MKFKIKNVSTNTEKIIKTSFKQHIYNLWGLFSFILFLALLLFKVGYLSILITMIQLVVLNMSMKSYTDRIMLSLTNLFLGLFPTMYVIMCLNTSLMPVSVSIVGFILIVPMTVSLFDRITRKIIRKRKKKY